MNKKKVNAVRVIFLDIDGVLNTIRAHKKTEQEHAERVSLPCSLRIRWDADCIQNLNELIRITGAQIVLSSAWRSGYERGKENKAIRRAEQLMKEQGVTGKVIGITYDLSLLNANFNRGDEIKEWLKRHKNLKIKRYIILDDDCDFNKSQLRHHVKTNYENGLDWNKAKEALHLLMANEEYQARRGNSKIIGETNND